MRHDRRPKQIAVPIETPLGIFVDMEVWLDTAETAAVIAGILGVPVPPSSRLVFEPWVRVRLRPVEERDGTRRLVPDTLDYGVEVVSQDDGA